MNPTPSDVHVDAALTDISIAFLQAQSRFACRTVFPTVPVNHQTDKYFKWNRGDFNRDDAEKRAPTAESAGTGTRLTTATYEADVWAVHEDVDDQTIANADPAVDPEDTAAEVVMNKLLIRQEREFNSTHMQPAVWANDYDGVSGTPGTNEVRQWSDYTNSTPIQDVRDAMFTIEENTGFTPNKLVLGARVFQKLLDHPDIIERINRGQTPGQPALANEQSLAMIFGVDEVVISRAVYNAAKEGATEDSNFIVGKSALLCYAAPSPGLRVPTAGYTFVWNSYLGQTNGMGVATKRLDFRPVDRNFTRIVGEIAMDMKVVATELGFYWDTIVA